MDILLSHIDVILNSINGFAYEYIFQIDTIKWFGKTENFLGLTTDQMPKNFWQFLEFIHDEDKPLLQNTFNELKNKTQESINLTYRLTNVQCDYLWFRDKGTLVTTQKGPILLGVMNDITQEMKTKEKLLAIKHKLIDINTNVINGTIIPAEKKSAGK